jgi:predicted metal-binding membrane protein
MARALRVPFALTALALGGWITSAVFMQGMAAEEGAASLESFLWLWVAMSAATMLPSLAPAASLAARVGRSSAAFVSGYFAVWCVSGVVAFEAGRVLTAAGSWLSAAAILAAAAYQLSPLKRSCLRRCRGPLGLLLRRAALRAGVEHGAACLGCCWALMLALLALGGGSMLWMGAGAAAIFVEKATSLGARASAPLALALAAAAVWVVL